MSASARLKAIDFYRKIPRDLTEASLSGAGLSIVAAISMIFLFGMELKSYLTISTTMTVLVDQSPNGELLRINFNFSFPSLSCEFASVDVTDVLGTARYNLTKTVRKFPINQDLMVVGPAHHPEPVPTPTKHGDDHDHGHEHGGIADTGKLSPEHERELMEGEVADENSGSLQLTDDNFDHFSHAYPILVVNFYAPWCPWSQRLEPAWEKTANVMNKKFNPETDGRIRVGRVDCTVTQTLCKRNHIQGFPSIRVFRKGVDVREDHGHHDHESYYGERDTESLVKFMESLVPVGVIEGRGLQQEEAEPPNPNVRRRAPSSGGCMIEGFVLVKKVPGNLMVSAHSGSHSFDTSSMNMTHVVQAFSFGRPISRRRMYMMERLVPHLEEKPRIVSKLFMSTHDNMTHDHYLQVVMTQVQPLQRVALDNAVHRSILSSYEYTVHSNTITSLTLPVVRFHYELSPMQVLITENRRPFSHFITNLCAIIGGVFTVAGIVDGMLHGALRMIKKVELGKQF
eukprot:TRINITY_DN1404_c0_g1_i1.p1 TRINITY_DN1404_c0_g1~~TRINITY_DN1404_c0_g1_i1.p1  ORF type:complete len:512 (+),score=119.19 TRINITY_DN1404_c0_g1_i1:48-1583(+)